RACPTPRAHASASRRAPRRCGWPGARRRGAPRPSRGEATCWAASLARSTGSRCACRLVGADRPSTRRWACAEDTSSASRAERGEVPPARQCRAGCPPSSVEALRAYEEALLGAAAEARLLVGEVGEVPADAEAQVADDDAVDLDGDAVGERRAGAV